MLFHRSTNLKIKVLSAIVNRLSVIFLFSPGKILDAQEIRKIMFVEDLCFAKLKKVEVANQM
jgi:hypothetical protein